MQDNNSNAVYRAVLEVIKEGIFWFAVVLAYFKTAELMSFFSPRRIMGFVGIEEWYGLGAALLVELTFVVMKYRLQFDDNPYSKLFSGIMAVGAIAMSGLAQGLDTAMIKGTVEALPVPVQQFLGVFVPAIPVIVMASITVSDAVTRQYKGSTESTVDVLKGLLGKFAQSPASELVRQTLVAPTTTNNRASDIPTKRGPGRPRKIVTPAIEQKPEGDNKENPTLPPSPP